MCASLASYNEVYVKSIRITLELCGFIWKECKIIIELRKHLKLCLVLI